VQRLTSTTINNYGGEDQERCVAIFYAIRIRRGRYVHRVQEDVQARQGQHVESNQPSGTHASERASALQRGG